eukprot:CAMPEP_0177793628 /NCGR_PEP_ID=MMETSP0491_2-20121128/25186_1 /TAXON_ID=63592 /ORGANISM="Tetraselmis chuii, Strain PLY429" /LENGTH=306 /DNA_ID=CAMNT_0019316175 /DNA_START=79 /DNA_END=996 /DNA_ORIENTATION=-
MAVVAARAPHWPTRRSPAAVRNGPTRRFTPAPTVALSPQPLAGLSHRHAGVVATIGRNARGASRRAGRGRRWVPTRAMMGGSEVAEEHYDVVVVGAGHAGCEAALAAARMGCNTLLLTLSLDKIAWQPCNPAVGGPAKSQLVHEVDALGGEIGKMADRCYLQKRILNSSKGPAVWALRAQTDKLQYAREMRSVLENTENLSIREAMVTDIEIGANDEVTGVRWFSFDPAVHVEQAQVACHLTRTTAATHALIEANLHETPTYGGWVAGKGPRYCPSIEDKIVRFKDKDSHQVFLEPEGRDTPELYV